MHSLSSYFSICLLMISVTYGQPENNGTKDSCSGKLQSPININDKSVTPVRLTPLVFNGFNSAPKSMIVTNIGHTVKVEIKNTLLTSLTGGPLKEIFVFSHMHFHWGAVDSSGSENKINNHSFAMELHMVLYNWKHQSLSEALKKEHGVTVLAVFFEAFDFENSAYATVVDNLHYVIETRTTKFIQKPPPLDAFLPLNKYQYYAYNGSMTTPPCKEGVIWIEFRETVSLSHAQIEKFRKLRSPTGGEMTENIRPVQPLGSRTVIFNAGERPVLWKNRNSGTTISPFSWATLMLFFLL